MKEIIKKGLKQMFAKRPIKTSANIVQLAQNQLLLGRRALITGGTSGIGLSIAQAFLNAGASVVITGRSDERIKKALDVLACPDRACGYVLDNSVVNSFEPTFNNILRGGGIDILVNNAGVLGAVLPNAKEDDYDIILNTNLKGAFFLSQLVGKYMKNNKVKGNILNIASSSSLRPAVSAYTLSKWGLRGLTLGLGKALAPYGITVNGLAPGPTATPMLMKDTSNITNNLIPLGRYVLPEEIANMAVFLVSEMGRPIIGDIVYMTGGAGVVTYEDMDYSF